MRAFSAGRMVKRNSFEQIKTVLVPGAGNGPVDGRPNMTFIGRVDTAYSIWSDYQPINLILSGYEDYKYFHEVRQMREELLAKGVPDSVIVTDEGSPDTFETLTYYKNEFRNNPVIILSQRNHLERALWIADKMEIEAYGYEVGSYSNQDSGILSFREIGARIKARIEVWIYL